MLRAFEWAFSWKILVQKITWTLPLWTFHSISHGIQIRKNIYAWLCSLSCPRYANTEERGGTHVQEGRTHGQGEKLTGMIFITRNEYEEFKSPAIWFHTTQNLCLHLPLWTSPSALLLNIILSFSALYSWQTGKKRFSIREKLSLILWNTFISPVCVLFSWSM